MELGTGYYCDKEIPAAVQLIDRKIQLVNSSIESVENVRLPLLCHKCHVCLIIDNDSSSLKVTGNKKKTLEQLFQIMQYKMGQLSDKQKS